MARTLDLALKIFEIDEPRGLKFCREVKYRKIFNTCLGFFLDLDQGPEGALKFMFFLHMARAFEGMDLGT